MVGYLLVLGSRTIQPAEPVVAAVSTLPRYQTSADFHCDKMALSRLAKTHVARKCKLTSHPGRVPSS